MSETIGPKISTTAGVAMTLAAIAYSQGRDKIETLLQDPLLATDGRWALEWYAADDANQMYVARDAGSGQRAVAIRGTAGAIDTLSFWVDWFEEDLNTLRMVDWPYGGAPNGARLARGTYDGLEHLLRLKDSRTGQPLLGFLRSVLTPGASNLTAVVGHSLGGTLASILPAVLSQAIYGANVFGFWGVTFAGATPGNDVLAAWLQDSFAGTLGRYWNRLDVVPHAWADLNWIAKSFPRPGPSIPVVAAVAVDAVRAILAELHDDYTAIGTGQPLDGALLGGDTWAAEVGAQHAHNNYLALLGAPPVDA